MGLKKLREKVKKHQEKVKEKVCMLSSIPQIPNNKCDFMAWDIRTYIFALGFLRG